MRTLSRCSSAGADIRTAQHFLRGAGHYYGHAHGEFDEPTEEAVRLWQREHDLTPSGKIDTETLGRMISAGLPVVADHDAALPAAPDVALLTNNEERFRHWGRFRFELDPQPKQPERIRILDAWEAQNIVAVACPVFGPGNIFLHKRVVGDYLSFIADVVAQGLAGDLAGPVESYAPRLMRGSRTTLSAHAFGIAIGFSECHCPLGATPPGLTAPTSYRRLAETALRHRWHWGGWSKRVEGAHFEHL